MHSGISESLGYHEDQTSQSIFIGKTDAKAEAPILWPPDVKSWLTGWNPAVERLWAGGEGGYRG